MQEQPTGPAGLPIKPHKPRCNFGRSHRWVECESLYGPGAQCETCGAVSSDHPAADQDRGSVR